MGKKKKNQRKRLRKRLRKMSRSDRDIISQNFTITNFNEDLALDCDSTTDGELADVLSTLIQELKAQGIISADIS